MFAIAHDGFFQNRFYETIEEAKKVWLRDVRNTLLYEYDCAVYELDENKKVTRVVPYSEIMSDT